MKILCLQFKLLVNIISALIRMGEKNTFKRSLKSIYIAELITASFNHI